MAIETRTGALATAVALALALFVPSAALAAGGNAAHGGLPTKAVAFIRTMARGHFKSAETDFTARMKRAAPPQKLAALWHAFLKDLGPFQGTGKTLTVDQGGFESVVVRLNFKFHPIGLAVTFDSAERIAGLHPASPP